jgi:hypothetical protein
MGRGIDKIKTIQQPKGWLTSPAGGKIPTVK